MDIKDLLELIHSYPPLEIGGGALHIVLDDGNVEDDNIWWCVANSIAEEKDTHALQIALALLDVPLERRYDLYENGWEMKPQNNSW
jgi:hypothetical protein